MIYFSVVNMKEKSNMDKKITLLIIDKDEDYAKNLCTVAKNHPAFFDAVYVSVGVNVYSTLEIFKPDFIITDFLMPGFDVMQFLRFLKTDYGKPKPFVIINSLTVTQSMIKSAGNHGADYFMIKPQPYYEICNTISELAGENLISTTKPDANDDSVDVKITHFLHCMGVPAHLNGYNYIRSSLKFAINDISTLDPITRKLYPMVAQKYNKSPQCIERSIRHAIKVSWTRGNKKVIYDIFGISPDSNRHGYPTNSEYIAMLADDLRIRLKHNIAI